MSALIAARDPVVPVSAACAALGVSLAKQQAGARFRTGDIVVNPSAELAKLTKGRYQKVSGSRVIGVNLDIGNGRSPSFSCLIAGIRRFEQELLAFP